MTSAAGRIIVGVDGSKASEDALQWAANEASLRGLGLHVVTCWTPTVVPYIGVVPDHEAEREAETIANAMIEEVLGSARQDLDVTVELLEGPAALRLLDFELIGEMIVVGSRGRGGFAGLLLGSVSQHLAEHARCPVVVIHGSSSQE